jgi:hypothetical protein
MKPKQIITALLLAFVGVSVVFLVVKETRSRPENVNPVGQTTLAQEPASTAPPTENSAATEIPQASPKTPDGVPAPSAARAKSQPSMPDRTVVAYYFHGNFRCQTCRKIEALSREAVESGFPEELKNGKLEWRVVNVEESGNQHFIEDYRLFSKSVILVRFDDGRQKEWKNLLDVWRLVGDKGAFLRYVQNEVKAYLAAS